MVLMKQEAIRPDSPAWRIGYLAQLDQSRQGGS